MIVLSCLVLSLLEKHVTSVGCLLVQAGLCRTVETVEQNHALVHFAMQRQAGDSKLVTLIRGSHTNQSRQADLGWQLNYFQGWSKELRWYEPVCRQSTWYLIVVLTSIEP